MIHSHENITWWRHEHYFVLTARKLNKLPKHCKNTFWTNDVCKSIWTFLYYSLFLSFKPSFFNVSLKSVWFNANNQEEKTHRTFVFFSQNRTFSGEQMYRVQLGARSPYSTQLPGLPVKSWSVWWAPRRPLLQICSGPFTYSMQELFLSSNMSQLDTLLSGSFDRGRRTNW